MKSVSTRLVRDTRKRNYTVGKVRPRYGVRARDVLRMARADGCRVPRGINLREDVDPALRFAVSVRLAVQGKEVCAYGSGVCHNVSDICGRVSLARGVRALLRDFRVGRNDEREGLRVGDVPM
jgi:hypothetical protein